MKYKWVKDRKWAREYYMDQDGNGLGSVVKMQEGDAPWLADIIKTNRTADVNHYIGCYRSRSRAKKAVEKEVKRRLTRARRSKMGKEVGTSDE